MQSLNGAETTGSPVHSDFPGVITKTPQANGGVKPIITSHMIDGNSRTLMPGERDLGNMSKNSPT